MGPNWEGSYIVSKQGAWLAEALKKSQMKNIITGKLESPQKVTKYLFTSHKLQIEKPFFASTNIRSRLSHKKEKEKERERERIREIKEERGKKKGQRKRDLKIFPLKHATPSEYVY